MFIPIFISYSVAQVTHSYYNYNGAECPNKYWFCQIFTFYQNSQNQEQSSEAKEKKKNEEKKKNQIRIFIYQLYPIYKIKNSKIINC